MMTPREIIGRAIYDEYDRRGAGHTISWGAMADKVPHECEPYLKMADAILSDLTAAGIALVGPDT